MQSADMNTAGNGPRLVPCLNATGFEIQQPDDPYTNAFVEFAPRAPGAVLEIGAAFGAAGSRVLSKNVPFIANDIDPRHLEVFKERTPPELRPLLRLMPGRFPEELDLAPGSLGAILISRVMHCFSPRQVEETVGRMFTLLAPGGKVFAIGDTPYLRSVSSFLPVYLERKARGDQWPGWCENFKEVVDPEFRSYVQEAAHCWDDETFPKLFALAGFRIEQSAFIPRPFYPDGLRLDGREGVGVIAVKP